MKKSYLWLALSLFTIVNVQAQNWNEIIKATASDRGSTDQFGYSVAISGDYAIVGAYQEDEDAAGNNTLSNAGSAYIFKNTAGTWSQVQKIVASDRGAGDNFGFSVSINGDYAIVGAYQEDEDAAGNNILAGAGSAYIFKNTLGTWSQVQKVVASDRGAGDNFGFSVAINGDYAIVGAYSEDEDAAGNNAFNNPGSAYIYKNNSGTWSQVQKIVASDRANYDRFGRSVAISGDYAIVGAHLENEDAAGNNALSDAGSAYIFKNTLGTWSQVQKVVASDRGAIDYFGFSVAINGDYAIVGAYNEDEDAAGGNTLSTAGSAYIFKNTAGTWSQVQKIVATDRGAFDDFGISVAINGDYAIVGAYFEDEDAGGVNALTTAGSAYIFKNTAGTWSQVKKIVASDRGVNDLFGVSVAISGDHAIVGAYQEDQDAAGNNTLSNAGSAYIFANPSCNITAMAAGTQTACSSNTYTQEVTVTYSLAPLTGTLDVNGQSFAIGTSPQTVTLTGLTANSQNVDVTAAFSDDAGCTLTETALFTAPASCAASTALHFAGSSTAGQDDRISGDESSLPMGTSPRTVEMWVKYGGSEVNSDPAFLDYGTKSANQRAKFGIFNSAAYPGNFFFTDGANTVISTTSIADGQWHHIAYTFDGTNTVKLYLDGALDQTSTSFGLMNTLIGDGFLINKGADSWYLHSWTGLLDNFKVWDKDLLQSDLKASMNGCLATTDPNLVLFYNFEEGIANGNNTALPGGTNQTHALDQSGNGINGLLETFLRDGYTSNWVSGQTFDQASVCGPIVGLSGNVRSIVHRATPENSNHTSFGSLASGGSLVRTFTISNTGIEDVILNGSPLVAISVGNDFTVTQPATTTLIPGASTTFDVTFTPNTTGQQTAELSILSNDPRSPFTFEIQGSINTAINFDGNDDNIISAPLGIALKEKTLMAWVKLDNINQQGGGLVNIQTPNGVTFDAIVYNEQIQGNGWGFGSDGFNRTSWSGVKETTTDWVHITATYSDNDYKLYRNGVLIHSNNSYAAYQFAILDVSNIGERHNGATHLAGTIDEVSVWNRVLCQAEIEGRMNSSLQGNENGLVIYYDFEEGMPSGTNTGINEAKDKANNLDGTLIGFAKTGGTSNWVNGNALTDDGLITGTLATWNGTTSDWNTATNWTPSGIPDQCTDVVIPVTGNNPTFSNNQAVNGIEVLSGASLTVGAGGCLWVGSTFTNNGDFILEATASAYAQYLGPQVTGTLQQVFGETGWHSIASPFIDANLGDIVFDNGAFLQYGAANKCNINYYDPGVHQASPPGTWTNAWGSWVCATDGSDPFDGSRAYNIFLDDFFVSGNFTTVTMSVTGTLRNMPITPQLNGANGGWNQLSNPFPSVIEWEKWSDNSAISSTYYVWDATLSSFNTYMTGGTSVPSGILTPYIAPYQSVFVRTTNGLSSNSGDEPDAFQNHLTSNADRPTTCPAAINSFYKTTVTGHLYIEAKTNDQKHSDQLAIRFGNGFSSGFKADEEAVKFFSPKEEVPSIFTIIEDRAFVISSFPEPGTAIESIPLGLQTKVGQSISFVATEIPEGVTAILEDKLEKTYTNLKKSYSFKSTKTLDNNRFVLHLGDEYFTKSDISGSGDLLAFINNGELKFMTNPSLEGGDVELINMSIQTLVKAKYSNETSIDVSSYPAGVYLIIVKKRGEVFRQKIIIQ